MFFRSLIALSLLLASSFILQAQLSLPNIFCDSMIVQRDQEFHLWGMSTPKEKITVSIGKQALKTKADDKGNWSVIIPPMPAGGPFQIDIKGKKQSMQLREILFGDVFLCIGQSNMVHYFGVHEVTYADEIEKANNPKIRQILVPTMTNMEAAQKDLPEKIGWKYANPEDINKFSVVAYYFGKEIQKAQGVPIGLINASVGGTPIEAWTPESGFASNEKLMEIIQQNKDTAYVNSVNNARPQGNGNATPPYRPTDKGEEEKWYLPGNTSQHWRPINIPGFWEDQGLKDLNGSVWYKKEIDIPAGFASQRVRIHLGRIVDANEVYVNGTKVGTTTYMYPQRRYWVEPGILKPGKNLFVIKVTNNNGKGGFVPDKPYYLEAGDQTVDLKGTWYYKVGMVSEPFRPGGGQGGGFPRRIVAQNQPTALYNAMAAPFTAFKIKGIIWYQGESNAGKPAEYEELQKNQITALRKAFGNENLPFLMAQLPGFGDYNYLPSESGWARLRESQAMAAKMPNAGMAVTIDLGEWNDIHPENKKEVGERLALAGRKIIYGEDIPYSGPIYKSHVIEGDKIIISFDHANGLKTVDGEQVGDLAIAGEDKQFVWANSKIEGGKLIVSSPRVSSPKYVRYAWADTPINPNLANGSGLLASPFRTDSDQ